MTVVMVVSMAMTVVLNAMMPVMDKAMAVHMATAMGANHVMIRM